MVEELLLYFAPKKCLEEEKCALKPMTNPMVDGLGLQKNRFSKQTMRWRTSNTMVENEVQWLAKTFYPYRNMAHLTILFAGYLRSPWALLTIFLTELVKRGASVNYGVGPY